MQPYPHQEIERAWQERWQRSPTFRADDFSKKEKSYLLIEFPFTSGDGLHVGHVRSYSAFDALARMQRLQGKNVLFPIGYDAFGLPTENYALKTGKHPRAITDENITTFRRQMQNLGLSFDWSREVDTSDPRYYRWTQWLFLQFLKRGLAYRARMPINWCPKDRIGLANEEVVGGRCERCGTDVVKKEQTQWMLKITAYAKRLLADLETVQYLEKIKVQQVHWIGKSEGAEIHFRIAASSASKVLLATNNPSKIARVRKLLARVLPGVSLVTPAEAGLSAADVAEGSDLARNAEAKARAYAGKTELPILGMDSGLFIAGARDDPAMVKRNALGGADASSLTDEEVGTRMYAYYRKIAEDAGGAAPAYFLDALALVQPDGTVRHASARRDIILTSKQRGTLDVHFPIRCLYRIKATGKYAMEQSEEEELGKDLLPLTNALLALLTPSVAVFTTRPDTLFGAMYLVLSPEHPVVQNSKLPITNAEEVEAYIERSRKKSDLERTDLAKEKTGVELKGVKAINPANGETIPVWVADYVLPHYGTGAIMAVPAHDERDFTFAKKYGLPVREVIRATGEDVTQSAYAGDGVLVNSGQFNGTESSKATSAITSWLAEHRVGRKATTYKLRDWLFSRQHYWGEPIPIVHCDQCREDVLRNAHELRFRDAETWERLTNGRKTVETRALNPEEPERHFANIADGAFLKCIFVPTGETRYFRVAATWIFRNLEDLFKHHDVVRKLHHGKTFRSVRELTESYAFTPDYLERIERNGLIAWAVEHVLPGVVPVPEPQLPVELPHVERYEPMSSGESPLAAVRDWVETSCPRCGAPARRETDTMPNWAGSSWYFLRYCDPQNDQTFADREKLNYWMPVDLYNGGMEHTTLHLLYSRFWHKFLFDQQLVPHPEPYRRRHSHGIVLAEDGRKMSKSFGNVINPDDLVREYGADSVRTYEMFMGPFEDTIPWSHRGIVGVRRFLQNVYDLVLEHAEPAGDASEEDLMLLTHRTVKRVTDDLTALRFNTAVAALMEMTNALRRVRNRSSAEYRGAIRTLLVLLFPFAPHLASELWERACGGNIEQQSWPTHDETVLAAATVTLVVQVNGRVRARLQTSPTVTQEDALTQALAEPNVRKYVAGDPKKVVFVPGRLINLLTG